MIIKYWILISQMAARKHGFMKGPSPKKGIEMQLLDRVI